MREFNDEVCLQCTHLEDESGQCHYNCQRGVCYPYFEPNFKVKAELDPVNHPDHYQSQSGLEVIDAIKAFTEDCVGIEAVYTGNVIKYICRYKKKNGVQDLKKAEWYLQHLIRHEELLEANNKVKENK